MILQFDEKVTKSLRAWFKRNGFTCGCSFANKSFIPSFCYNGETHRVELPKTYNTEAIEENFISYLEEKGLSVEANWLAMTILHEVGHSETVRLFTKKEQETNARRKMILGFQMTDDNIDEINRLYWGLPIESMANKWAISYANTFPEKVKRLEKVLYRHCKITEN